MQWVHVVPLHGGDGARLSQVENTSASCVEEDTPPTLSPPLPPPIDLLDMRACPSLEVYRKNRKNRNKAPYVELGISDVVYISEEDENILRCMTWCVVFRRDPLR